MCPGAFAARVPLAAYSSMSGSKICWPGMCYILRVEHLAKRFEREPPN